MADTVNVQGLSELKERLQALPKNISRNVLRGSVAAGAAVIRDEARAQAPAYTGEVSAGHPPPGTLKRSIIIKQIREKSGPQLQTFYVAVRRGKKYGKQGKKGNLSQDAFYASWVEFGHWVNTGKALGGGRLRDLKRQVAIAGGMSKFVPARPFMRPAFESKKEAALQAIKAYLEKRIPIEAAKLK